jgi:hypothetical protein
LVILPDVNELIVQQWLELQGKVCTTNFTFWTTRRRIGGTSDIDIVAFDPRPGQSRWSVYEVKGWHSEVMGPATLKDPKLEWRIFHFTSDEAKSALKEYTRALPEDIEYVLVVSKLPKSKEKREAAIKICKEKGVDRVIEFKDVLKDVIEKIEKNKNYGHSEFLQTLRLLKVYDFIK